MSIPLLIAGVVLCIMFSAFFSASEMAFSSCNEMRLEKEDSKRGRMALYIVQHFEDALGAILIGNNLVNIASSSMCSVLVLLIAGSDKYAWVATVIVTILVIIFGETMPKIVAKKNATRLALTNAPVVRFLMIILKPVVLLVVFLVNLITGRLKGEDAGEGVEELQSIIETAEDEDVLDEDQSELVQAAIDFPEISAMDVMTARVDVEAIDIEDDWEEILAVIDGAHHSRLPVYEDSIDHIIGVLHLNRFLKAMTASPDRRVDIRSLLMEPCYVYKTMKMPAVLNQLQNENQHLAIVGDEYGGTLGVISMEDVLEQIVGDIWDETDMVDEDITERADGSYELAGELPVADFAELFDLREEDLDAESNTVGGWTVERFGDFPEEGDSFTCLGVTVTVLKLDGRRVEKVLAQKTEEGPKKS